MYVGVVGKMELKRISSTEVWMESVAYPGILFGGGGFHQIQLRTEDRENGDLRAVAPYPLVKGSGGSCNMVQEISFHTVKVS